MDWFFSLEAIFAILAVIYIISANFKRAAITNVGLILSEKAASLYKRGNSVEVVPPACARFLYKASKRFAVSDVSIPCIFCIFSSGIHIRPFCRALSTYIKGGRAINIVPDLCTGFGDVRILPGITKDYIEDAIKKKLKNLGIEYRISPIVYVPPSYINPEEKIVRALKRSTKEITGREPIAEGSGPWSDIWMFIKKGIPAVNFGCDGGGFHDKDEYVEIKSVLEVTKIYALTALEFFKS